MTDMRATERLLEVIQELAREASTAASFGGTDRALDLLLDIHVAAAELRRRGDTLVRSADLRLVLEDFGRIWDPDAPSNAAAERLQGALG